MVIIINGIYISYIMYVYVSIYILHYNSYRTNFYQIIVYIYVYVNNNLLQTFLKIIKYSNS